MICQWQEREDNLSSPMVSKSIIAQAGDCGKPFCEAVAFINPF